MSKRLMLVALVAGLGLWLSGCPTPRFRTTQTQYEAVLMTRTELEAAVALLPPRPIEQAGKVWQQDTWILIVERFKGIHLIDNAQPRQPVKRHFLRIPGCMDVGTARGALYADSSVDLLTFDWTALRQGRLVLTSRHRQALPEYAPDFGDIPAQYRAANRPPNTVITEWRLK